MHRQVRKSSQKFAKKLYYFVWATPKQPPDINGHPTHSPTHCGFSLLCSPPPPQLIFCYLFNATKFISPPSLFFVLSNKFEFIYTCCIYSKRWSKWWHQYWTMKRAYPALYLGGTSSQETVTSPPSCLLLENHLCRDRGNDFSFPFLKISSSIKKSFLFGYPKYNSRFFSFLGYPKISSF